MYKIGETDLTLSIEDQEKWGFERSEKLLIFQLTDEECEHYENLSPIEIMTELEKLGFNSESNYYVQPGARYTNYEFVALVPHGFEGQLIIRQIDSYNV